MWQFPRPKTWAGFEQLLADYAFYELGDPGADRYGRSGQTQHGIDILAHDRRGKDRTASLWGIQAKRYDSAPRVAQAQTDLVAALGHFEHLSVFVLATTTPRDQKLQDWACGAEARLKNEGRDVDVHVWFWAGLWERLWLCRWFREKYVVPYWGCVGASSSSARDEPGAREREPDRRTTNALARVESENQDWIATTRSFPFQRLQQAIKEMEPIHGRLEAARAFHLALQRSDAMAEASERNLLRACDELDSSPLIQANWRLHRMLSRIVGDLIGQCSRSGNQSLVDRFCEPRLCTPDGVRFLAEAGSEHTEAAQALGAALLRRLLLSSQPQVTWQLLRRWPRVSPLLSAGIDLNEIMENPVASVKRMLLLSQIHSTRYALAAQKRVLASVQDDRNKPGDLHSFNHALIAWSSRNTTAGLVTRRSIVRIQDLLSIASLAAGVPDDLPVQIAHSLELDSLERDLRNMEGGYEPHPREYSGGRYGHTRHYVRQALGLIPQDLVGRLLDELLDCTDEGIRWGVAAEIATWWPLVPDGGLAARFALRLVDDAHPWVLREALQQVGADPWLPDVVGRSRLLSTAQESLRRAAAVGWDTTAPRAAMHSIGVDSP